MTTTPTAEQWDELLQLVNDQADALQRVRELHQPTDGLHDSTDIALRVYCCTCMTSYTCATIQALDGELYQNHTANYTKIPSDSAQA